MTRFVSVALFRRDNGIVFKAPRKEGVADKTQARKAASRYWNGAIRAPDVLAKVVLLTCDGGKVCVSERSFGAKSSRPWIEFAMSADDAVKQGHLAACLAELGVDPAKTPPPMPDTLEINGVIYRRDI